MGHIHDDNEKAVRLREAAGAVQNAADILAQITSENVQTAVLKTKITQDINGGIWNTGDLRNLSDLLSRASVLSNKKTVLKTALEVLKAAEPDMNYKNELQAAADSL